MNDTDPADLIRQALQSHSWALLGEIAKLVGPPQRGPCQGTRYTIRLARSK
jgi:hypothetical protein